MFPSCSSSQGHHHPSTSINSRSAKAAKKKPFIISRQPSRETSSMIERRNSGALEQSRALALPNPQIEAQNKILASQTTFKNCYSLFKVSPNLLPELLQKYAEANVKYRDEEFTQQADTFLTKIAASKKIPKDVKVKYPIYHILVSLSKIFMLNEYEIVVLGCALDYCNWKVEETVYPEEASFLREFPGNLGPEIDSECKRLVIYLLIITFSLKQYLNEKGEVDKVHAYCESICTNFQAIFNRWTRVSAYHKFNYSPLEINRKFKFLSQHEDVDPLTSSKDYNTIVDSIMTLTNAYKSKISPKPAPCNPFVAPQPIFQTPLFQNFELPPIPEPKPIACNEVPYLPDTTFDKGFSKMKNDTFNLELMESMPLFEGLSRRGSSINPLEEFGRKKVKFGGLPATSGLSRENSFFREFSNIINNGNMLNPEEFLLSAPLPGFSKRSSLASQLAEDQQSMFRFHSNISSWMKE